jgi:hypothetical protein
MREFEAFMILLMHDGEDQAILKQIIDSEFDHKSATKGYDYINNLCKNKVIEKMGDKQHVMYLSDKKLKELKDSLEKYKLKNTKPKKSLEIIRIPFAYKKKTKVYIKSAIRKEYEKYMLPTIKNLDDSLKEIIKEYIDGIKEEEKVREKFKAYTETIILAIQELIEREPSKSLNSQRFQKKINDNIWKYFRSEILKYEVFSK